MLKDYNYLNLTTCRYGQIPVIIIVLPNAETKTDTKTIYIDLTPSSLRWLEKSFNFFLIVDFMVVLIDEVNSQLGQF